MATVANAMTTEELLALPEDGMERWLLAGELKERPMTKRNRFHCKAMACITTELEIWRRQQPEPRGDVLTGDLGVRLRRDPDTTFGVDVAYISADVLARQTEDSTIIDGVPLLAVEILSPNDVLEDVDDKIDAYLAAGVPLVWVVSPRRRTVTVHAPGDEPVLLDVRQELSAEPHLPGFRVPVRRLFE
jgi:Uma2 family endonuclease